MDAKRRRTGPPENFQQATLHEYLLGMKPSVTHTAEADCLSLMRITAVLGPDWTDWVEGNAKKLSSINV